MENAQRTARAVLIRDLMDDVAPAEVPLTADYIAALEAPEAGSVDGFEFGIEDIVSTIGPYVALAGAALYASLSKWAVERTADVIKKYLVLGGEKILQTWLGRPSKGGLKGALTPEGKQELLRPVRAAFNGKKVSKDKVDKVMAAIERRLSNDA